MNREGKLVTIDGRPALRFERRYRHHIERVWRAVTDPDEMAQWFPSSVTGDREVGAALLFDDDAQRAAAREAGEPTRADGPMFHGKVLGYEPPHLFAFTWAGEIIRIELTAEEAETMLVFTQILSHQSVAARNGAGWHACLKELDRVLDSPTVEEDWMGVYEDYLHRMGPALGVSSGHGAMTWERSTHVVPERVRQATSQPTEIEAWAGAGRPTEPLHWEVEETENGTLYRLVHDGIDGDAERAAAWHARLIQLDMYLAAGQVIPVAPDRWVAAYDSVL